MADAKIDMALDDIIKKNRGGPGNRRGRGRGRGGNAASGGVQRQQRGGANRGSSRGRIGKANNNRGRGGGVGGGLRRGGGRNSFNQGNNNRSNNNRQQRGNGNSFSGLTRRNKAGDKPTATYNPLNRDETLAATKPLQQPRIQAAPRARQQPQQGSVFNKIRRNAPAANPNVGVLRRRMLAAQQALNRATKTLAAMPRLKKQRQQFLQQPQQLRNLITRNRIAGGAVRKRLGVGRKTIGGRGMGRGGARRMFV